jgi:hypothetical protein
MKISFIIIVVLLTSTSCTKNAINKTNKNFSKQYGKDVREVMKKFSPRRKLVVNTDYRRHSDVIGVSSIFNLENTKINNFKNRRLYNPQVRLSKGNQMPIENFITIDENLFKPQYQEFKKKPYRLEEVIFDNMRIPYNDIFGKLSNITYKKYHLVNKEILQKEVDKILEKFDDEYRAILLRTMKDKEIIMERISKNMSKR